MQLLKKINRTLLEVWTGILLFGLICEIFGILFAPHLVRYSVSLWTGALGAVASTVYSYISLDRALDLEESAAQKKIYMAYVIRYVFLTVAFLIICVTNVISPLVVFLGYMLLKAAAFCQPFVHKFYNWVFGEQDPIPTPMPEELDYTE